MLERGHCRGLDVAGNDMIVFNQRMASHEYRGLIAIHDFALSDDDRRYFMRCCPNIR